MRNIAFKKIPISNIQINILMVKSCSFSIQIIIRIKCSHISAKNKVLPKIRHRISKSQMKNLPNTFIIIFLYLLTYIQSLNLTNFASNLKIYKKFTRTSIMKN